MIREVEDDYVFIKPRSDWECLQVLSKGGWWRCSPELLAVWYKDWAVICVNHWHMVICEKMLCVDCLCNRCWSSCTASSRCHTMQVMLWHWEGWMASEICWGMSVCLCLCLSMCLCVCCFIMSISFMSVSVLIHVRVTNRHRHLFVCFFHIFC